MLNFISNHSMAHHIFHNHSRLELLKIAKIRFDSYYFTFRCLSKVREALVGVISSDSLKGLKNNVTFISNRHEFHEVDIVLDGQFWKHVRYVL